MSNTSPDAPRRVVFVTITFHPEPGALRGLPLARELKERHGWDVEVITAVPWYPLGRAYPGYRMRLYQREVIDGIVVHRLPLYPSHDRSAARRMMTYASFMVAALLIAPFRVARAPLIYHVDNLPTTGIAVAWLRQLWDARVVQHIGDLWPDSVLESGMVSGGVLRRMMSVTLHGLMRALYATNTRITVITEGFRKTLVERGVSRDKVQVLPNWADEDRLRPVPASPSMRTEMGLDGRFVVLYAGNIGSLQALDVVLDAAGQMPSDSNVTFVLIGDGPDRERLDERMRRENLANVRILPPRPVEEMPALNALADALLVHLKDVPFLHETVPSKTQVSLLAGRPVLMGSRGEAARIIERARAGLVFQPGSGSELAAAARQLSEMPAAERQAMSERAQSYYWDNLSLAAGADAMASIFDEVTGVPRAIPLPSRAQSPAASSA